MGDGTTYCLLYTAAVFPLELNTEPVGPTSMELNGNNLTRITKSDFAGLKYIRVLQLMENQITVIERGAFDDMKELERLRLNRNQLQQLPELLFQKNPALSRLLFCRDL
ncbi:unnamed protein product [Tetraodon nigroviridis]|uniref:(spotted green pufferfish) hypothetical protein n=1 Tax=Tetraodon nigroviridis TaxID=99883 RepID=Q4RQH9_TETNG|nr:unnamed protein product [Tetraodon nigroviridis]